MEENVVLGGNHSKLSTARTNTVWKRRIKKDRQGSDIGGWCVYSDGTESHI